jgi:ABC-2 type transport system permease protein
MSPMAGFAPLYQRRVALAVNRPIALIGQALTPGLWILVVGPALAQAFGGFARNVDYFTYLAVGQIVFILPFSAMFAGLVVMQDRDFGILRELLVAPIRRATIPLASIAAILSVGAGQVGLMLALAALRGAHFSIALLPLIVALAAAALLTAGTYGLAEYLAYTITQPQIFGTLIPAIGATPYALCGAIYPIAVLPEAVRQFALALPWTHAVALLRYGFIGKSESGLEQIWHLQSQALMALLSLAVLAVYASLTTALAMRAFKRSTLK